MRVTGVVTDKPLVTMLSEGSSTFKMLYKLGKWLGFYKGKRKTDKA
jgi:hypothetical protein